MNLKETEKKTGYLILPKFSVEADLDLKSVSKKLGVVDAFDSENADFSRLGTVAHPNKNICVDSLCRNYRKRQRTLS